MASAAAAAVSQATAEHRRYAVHDQAQAQHETALMPLNDRLRLRQRSTVETSLDQWQNISQMELSRHRSPVNGWVNLLGGLLVYCPQPKQPAIAIDHNLLLPA